MRIFSNQGYILILWDDTDSINNDKTRIACRWATSLVFYAGIGKWEQDSSTRTISNDVWVIGDWGYILNKNNPQDGTWAPGYEGENIINVGYKDKDDYFWGHISSSNTVYTLTDWFDMIKGWRSIDKKKVGAPVLDKSVTYPTVGLE